MTRQRKHGESEFRAVLRENREALETMRRLYGEGLRPNQIDYVKFDPFADYNPETHEVVNVEEP